LNEASFSIYGYYKRDNKSRSWVGTRMDFSTLTWKDRLGTSLELRFFGGLNKNSAIHYYVILSAYSRLDAQGIIRVGIFIYGKKTESQDPFLSTGLFS